MESANSCGNNKCGFLLFDLDLGVGLVRRAEATRNPGDWQDLKAVALVGLAGGLAETALGLRLPSEEMAHSSLKEEMWSPTELK